MLSVPDVEQLFNLCLPVHFVKFTFGFVYLEMVWVVPCKVTSVKAVELRVRLRIVSSTPIFSACFFLVIRPIFDVGFDWHFDYKFFCFFCEVTTILLILRFRNAHVIVYHILKIFYEGWSCGVINLNKIVTLPRNVFYCNLLIFIFKFPKNVFRSLIYVLPF